MTALPCRRKERSSRHGVSLTRIFPLQQRIHYSRTIFLVQGKFAQLTLWFKSGGNPAFEDLRYSVIAAAVLGGTSLFGGRGTVTGSMIGALMIALTNNGLILMGLKYSEQLIARGIIILLAVAVAVAGRNR
jgi:ribose/xylose/arabinose/galactoside ABC-type transport system permease subunit